MNIGKLVPILLLIASAGFGSCKRDDQPDDQFCTLLQQEKLDEAAIYSNVFLKDTSGKSDYSLELFSAWLHKNNCVQDVVINCRSCVKTYPPMSVMTISYKRANTQKKAEIDVRMGEQLSCEIHDR